MAKSFLRRWLGRVVWLLYVAALLELTARGYWTLRHSVPFTRMSDIFVGRFYPALRTSGVLSTSICRDDEFFDVLLLGPSVTTDQYGSIAPRLQDCLARMTERPVRLFNLSAEGLTSRDSLLMYQRLDTQQFDLVVFYHAINDARMNNCPRDMFRADYTHGSWYDRVERLRRSRGVDYSVLPYTAQYLTIGMLDSRLFNWYLPRNCPEDGLWFDEGHDIKTVDGFGENLRAIVELAQARGAQVLLPTFAYYLAPGYTRLLFEEHKLDYSKREHNDVWGAPIEMWGQPGAVTAAIEAHNAAARQVAGEFEHVIFVELDDELPKHGRHFDDICHLTHAGCQAWVDRVAPALRRELRAPASNTTGLVYSTAGGE